MPQPLAARGGFTLIEVLVATALVGMVALAIAPLMVMAVQTSAMAQESTELASRATEQIEVLRSLPFNHADLQAGGSLGSSQAGYSLDPLDGDPNRYMRWLVVDVSASRKRLEVAVGVRESVWGPPREIRIETYHTDLK